MDFFPAAESGVDGVSYLFTFVYSFFNLFFYFVFKNVYIQNKTKNLMKIQNCLWVFKISTANQKSKTFVKFGL
jgi:hypothetical protein